ncbi:hypothetical protein BJ166DRAFT_356418 [Pestalotiopsis sp. NC0098]|nr:hypothetical protein BJ166DRAFT_356418 [Pestalotiopsis sp. NC0098]
MLCEPVRSDKVAMTSILARPSGIIHENAKPQSQDIYSQSLECQRLFKANHDIRSPFAPQISASERRFLTWASLLGVFTDESASLDRRLEPLPELRRLIKSMLEVLERNLKLAIKINQTPRSLDENLTSVESDPVLFGILGAVDRLHRIATAIRRAPRTDEVERVRLFASKRSPDDFLGIMFAIVRFWFPDAEKPLQSQLAESVVYRRHRMLWSRRHTLKLGQKRRAGDSTDNSVKEIQPDEPSESRSSAQLRSPSNRARSAYSSTAPSIRALGDSRGSKTNRLLQISEEVRNEDNRSARSSDPSPTANWPKVPPPISGDESNRECGYCLNDISIPATASDEQSKNLWIDHLKLDLRPFVCISEECSGFPTSFSSSKEWLMHMRIHGADWPRRIHRSQWSCQSCGEDVALFASEELLVHHITQRHPDMCPKPVDAFEIAKMASKRKTIPLRKANHCPLCEKPPPWNKLDKLSGEIDVLNSNVEDLYKHLMDHLQHLSLLSISWWDLDTGKISDTSSGSSGLANTAVSVSNSHENKESAKLDLEWLKSDSWEHLTSSRVETEHQDQEKYETLVKQQIHIWEQLQHVQDQPSRVRYWELRDIRDITDIRDLEPSIVDELEHLYEALLLDFDSSISPKTRLEMISGDCIEAPYCKETETTESWAQVNLHMTSTKGEYKVSEDPVLAAIQKFQESMVQRPTSLGNVEVNKEKRKALRLTIRRALQTNAEELGSQRFMTSHRLSDLLPSREIESLLGLKQGKPEVESSDASYVLRRALKTLAILVYINAVDKFASLCQLFDDSCLPIGIEYPPDGDESWTTSSEWRVATLSEGTGVLDSQRRHPVFDTWDEDLVENFETAQWIFLPIEFSSDTFYQKFHRKQPLSLSPADFQREGEGHFSVLYKAKLPLVQTSTQQLDIVSMFLSLLAPSKSTKKPRHTFRSLVYTIALNRLRWPHLL